MTLRPHYDDPRLDGQPDWAVVARRYRGRYPEAQVTRRQYDACDALLHDLGESYGDAARIWIAHHADRPGDERHLLDLRTRRGRSAFIAWLTWRRDGIAAWEAGAPDLIGPVAAKVRVRLSDQQAEIDQLGEAADADRRRVIDELDKMRAKMDKLREQITLQEHSGQT